MEKLKNKYGSDMPQSVVKMAFKPFDIVSDNGGGIGIVQEVNFGEYCVKGKSSEWMPSYAITWLKGGKYHAWHFHNTLKLECNLFVVLAKMVCHLFGGNEECIVDLFNNASYK